MVDPNAPSNTKQELLDRARELGVRGASRMRKADLAEAVARKEAAQLVAQEEAQAAAEQAREAVWTAAREEYRSIAQEVRRNLRSLSQEEALSQVKADAEEEAAAPTALRGGPEAVSADDSERTTVQPARAARWNTPTQTPRVSAGLGITILAAVISALLTALITALATATLANDYYTSKLSDWFRRGDPPILSEVSLEREPGVQGLTWVINHEVGDRLTLENWKLMSSASAHPDDFNNWIRAEGGTDVGASFIEVVVTGNRQAGVVITGMKAQVERHGPPLREAFFHAPPEAERENARVGFNLDEGEPVARVVTPSKNFGDRGYLGREYFKGRNISLALGEKQVFAVVAMTSTSYYAWYIEMEVRAGGRTHYVRIDLGTDKDKPKPFEISARADSRSGQKGSFAVYKELYVLDRSTNPVGFRAVDPQTYAP